MSLRQIAKELGITPAYLSYMVNGKRPWREDLYQRYCQLVNTKGDSVNNAVNGVGGGNRKLEGESGTGYGYCYGDPPRDRTENLRIKSPLLCQLS
jgi:hypothetical protein